MTGRGLRTLGLALLAPVACAAVFGLYWLNERSPGNPGPVVILAAMALMGIPVLFWLGRLSRRASTSQERWGLVAIAAVAGLLFIGTAWMALRSVFRG